MSNVNWDLAGLELIASSKVTISSATTTAYDFGTPNDIDLTNSAYDHFDRVMFVFTASTGGTTNSITFSIQDADDNAGSIGTPATALTSVPVGALDAGTGDAFTVVAVHLQPNRPWLRARVTSTGATDTFVTHCLVLGVPNGV